MLYIGLESKLQQTPAKDTLLNIQIIVSPQVCMLEYEHSYCSLSITEQVLILLVWPH